MKLTPLDIRHKDFKRGMRGYVDSEVDEFLDEVADEFERLFKENIELAERCDTLQEKIDHYRTLEETLQKTLVSAQRSAEELKANSQKESQLILHEAELKARQMVNESYADKQAIEKQMVVLRSSEEDFRFKFRSLLEGYLKQLVEIDRSAKKDAGVAKTADEVKKAMATERRAVRPPATEAPPARPAEVPVREAAADAGTPPTPEAEPVPPLEAAPLPPARGEPAASAEAGGADEPLPAPDGRALGATIGEPDDLLADVESEVDDNEFKW
jgi:cell division initiation protein